MTTTPLPPPPEKNGFDALLEEFADSLPGQEYDDNGDPVPAQIPLASDELPDTMIPVRP